MFIFYRKGGALLANIASKVIVDMREFRLVLSLIAFIHYCKYYDTIMYILSENFLFIQLLNSLHLPVG